MHPDLEQHPHWHRTGNPYFPVAARVNEQWWVLRVNNFPDHPVWTLLVDGERRFDLDNQPANWGNPADRLTPVLSADEADEALRAVRGFDAYGSEIAQPCDNPFCCG